MHLSPVGRSFRVNRALLCVCFALPFAMRTLGHLKLYAQPTHDGVKATEVDLTRGLVGHFPFDENTEDVSGHENHGQPEGQVAFAEGKVGNAVHFQGIDNPGFVFIPNSESLQIETETTIACWFFIKDAAGMAGSGGEKIGNAHQTIVARHSDRTGFTLISLGEFPMPRQLSCIAHNFDNRVSGVTHPPDDPIGKWHHATSIAGRDRLRLYVDGRLVHDVDKGVDLAEVNKCGLIVGSQADRTIPTNPVGKMWFPLNGAVDEVRIYNRALNDKEIRQLAGLDEKDAGDAADTRGDLKPFAAAQVTGLPNTPTRHEGATTAWASETPDGQTEWLLLEYPKAVQPKELLIYETSNGGAVYKVSMLDPDGNEVEVWTGHTFQTRPVGTIMAALIPASMPYETKWVKVYINSAHHPGRNQIDAVAIRDVNGKDHWAIGATASSTWPDVVVAQ